MSPGQIAYGTRRTKLDTHGFELAAVIAFGLSGLNYLFNHQAGDRSSIGQRVVPFDLIWSGFYVAGALMVICGIFRESQRFRVAGLSMFMFGLLMQFVVAVSIDPLEFRDFVYLPYAFIAGRRAYQATRTVIPRGRGHASNSTAT